MCVFGGAWDMFLSDGGVVWGLGGGCGGRLCFCGGRCTGLFAEVG